jgi:hypothetical protein
MGMAVESGILHETAAIVRRFVALALISLLPATATAAAGLFDRDEVLDIRLSGPLGAISSHRKDEERQEHPFVLRIGDQEVPVHVRVRGKSRTVHCEFPPLRLRFEAGDTAGTVFAGQEKLKLVTHCRSGRDHFENNLLDEYAAYRIFNLLSDMSYRVRLLRVTYEDTDNDLGKLGRPYYAVILESDEGLAQRTGASVLEVAGVVYSRLDPGQAARMSVFHYLIANTDWSLVAAPDESCCHNVDLVEKDGTVFPIPYDFDRSGLVNAKYAKPAEGARIRKVTERRYRGYCRSPIDEVAAGLDAIVALRESIAELVSSVPVIGKESAEKRVQFVDRFFEEAVNDREKLLKRFEKDCIGRR